MAFQFITGATMADASRMGNARAERNRDADIAAADRTAQFAFQTYDLENRQAQQIAEIEHRRQQEQNQLDQIAYQEAAGRFQFGKNLEAQKRGEDWNKFTFSEGQKQNKAIMDLDRERYGLKTDRANNSGTVFASSIASLNQDLKAANDDYLKAQKSVDELFATASTKRNPSHVPAFDQVTGKWSGDMASYYLKELSLRNAALENAAGKLKEMKKALDREVSHAARERLTVDDDGLTSIDTGTRFRFGPTSTPSSTASAPASNVTRFDATGHPVGWNNPLAPRQPIELQGPPIEGQGSDFQPVEAPAPAWTPPPQSTGLLPRIGRAVPTVMQKVWNGHAWVFNNAPPIAAEMNQQARRAIRGVGDFFYNPAVGSPEYNRQEARRAAEDASETGYHFPQIPYSR